MLRKGQIAAALLLFSALAYASGSEEDGPIDTQGVHVIVVRSGSVDVQVTAGGGPEVFPEPGYRLVRQRDGSRLNVWVKSDGLFPPAGTGHVLVHAPRGTDVSVESTSGRILLEGIDGGSCRVSSVSGRIRLRHVRGGCSIHTVSGGVDLDSVEGSISARTVSGRIAGRRVNLTADSSFFSVSGDIEIGLTPALEALAFDLSSVSGRITVGEIRAEKGLRMGFGSTRVRGQTISGALSFQ
jgi:hypothetical protein